MAVNTEKVVVLSTAKLSDMNEIFVFQPRVTRLTILQELLGSHVRRKVKLPQATLKHIPLHAPGTKISCS